MRILIVTDSLGRPRPDLSLDERTVYEDVYGYLLADLLPPDFHVELHTFEGIDTNDAIELNKKTIAFRGPDMVVYQLGINDCAPRIFNKGANPLIYRMWFKKITRNLFGKLIKKNRYYLTKLLNRTYVDPSQFRLNLLRMQEDVLVYNPHCKFLAIEIALPPKRLLDRSFGFKEKVNQYNTIIKEIFRDRVVCFNDQVEDRERLITDGIHMTKKTHKKVAVSLQQMIMDKCAE